MLVSMDLEQMRASMELWREAVNTTRELAAQDVRAIEARLLHRIDASVTGWLDLLRLCSATGADRAQLEEITNELLRFQGWYEEVRAAMQLAGATSAGGGAPGDAPSARAG